MQQPLKITFRDIPHSDAVEANIREHAQNWTSSIDQIMSCRVMVEAPHGHHHQGKLFHVRIDLTVPGKELVASRAPVSITPRRCPMWRIRDAFAGGTAQLQNYKRRQKATSRARDTGPWPRYGTVTGRRLRPHSDQWTA